MARDYSVPTVQVIDETSSSGYRIVNKDSEDAKNLAPYLKNPEVAPKAPATAPMPGIKDAVNLQSNTPSTSSGIPSASDLVPSGKGNPGPRGTSSKKSK